MLGKCLILICFYSYFKNTQSTLQGAVIKGMGVPDVRNDLFTKHGPNGTSSLEGVQKTMFATLSEVLKFEPVELRGRFWLTIHENGSVGGMGRRVLNGEADIAINLYIMTPARQRRFDFLHTLTDVGLYVYFKQPEIPYVQELLISPLKPYVWYATLGTWLLLLVSMFSIFWIRKLFVNINHDDYETTAGVLFWIVSIFSKQSWYSTPGHLSLRIVFFCGSLFGFLLSLYFSSSLTSILVSRPNITTLQELASLTDFRILADNVFEHKEKAIQATEEFRDKNFRSIDLSSQLVSAHEGISAVVDGTAVFITFEDAFYTYFSKINEDKMMHENISPWAVYCEGFDRIEFKKYQAGVLVRKEWKHKEIFNQKILKLREIGLFHTLYKRHKMLSIPFCLPSSEKRRLNLSEYETPFEVLGVGYILSILALIFERCIYSVPYKYLP